MEGPYLKLPLQASGGMLQRYSRGEAVRRLLEAMAITPSGKWAGGERFGLHDLLHECSRVQQVESHPMRQVTTVAEAVLADFGFPGCRLVPDRAAVSGYSTLDFDFTLHWPDGSAEPISIKLSH